MSINPCIACGGSIGEVEHVNARDPATIWWRVRCPHPKAGIASPLRNSDMCTHEYASHESADNAVAGWNAGMSEPMSGELLAMLDAIS